MALLKDICGGVTESQVVEYRYYVALKTDLPGFKLTLATNVTAVSKADAVQKVRHHLGEVKEDFRDVLRQQWEISTITPIKPSGKAQQAKRMKNKKKG